VDALSVWPTWVVPEIVGSAVFVGAETVTVVPVTTVVGAEVAVVVPLEFVAETATRIVEPTSEEPGE
jgi:hypothetical protein